MASNINKNPKVMSQLSQINLWIEKYDEFFSDFDPSPYSKGMLSEDFLYEIKRVSNDKRYDTLNITILVPQSIRNSKINKIVKKRLKSYFLQQYQSSKDKKDKLVRKALLLFVIGFMFILTSTFIATYQDSMFFLKSAVLISEVIGWFSIWQTLDIFLYDTKEIIPELEFYNKLMKSEIKFVDY